MDRLQQYLSDLEEQETYNREACRTTAHKNGYTISQADGCENCELGCVTCPFKGEEKKVSPIWNKPIKGNPPNCS